MSQARIGAMVGAAFTLALWLPPAGATGVQWLSEREIASALTGHTLQGAYASGRRFSESYLDGGRLEYTEGGVTLHGHWSITEGTLCTIYDTDPTGGCFRVAPVGGTLGLVEEG